MSSFPNAGRRLSAFERRLLLVLVTLAYAATLQLIYMSMIAPLFSYLGERYAAPDPAAYAVGVAATAWMALQLPQQLAKPSDLILWLLFTLCAAPSVLTCHYSGAIKTDTALMLTLAVTAGFTVATWAARYNPIQQLQLRNASGILNAAACIFSLGFYSVMALTTGLHFRFVSLGDVQELRSGYYTTLSNLGGSFGYLLQIQAAVLNPYFMARGVSQRRPILIAVATVGQVLIFGVTGFKLTLLSPLAMLGVGLVARRRGTVTGTSILVTLTATSAAAFAIDSLRHSILLVSVFVNRLIVLPGVLTSAYVSVFQNGPKVVWSSSFLSHFVQNPYPVSPAFMVGGRFFGDYTVQANANPFADGYANLGWTGTAVEMAVVIAILWGLDACGRHLPLSFFGPQLLVAGLGLSNSSAFTSILTGGMLGCALVLAMADPRMTGPVPAERIPSRVRAAGVANGPGKDGSRCVA